MGKIKKVIAGLLVVALTGGAAAGALHYMKKSNQKEVMVVNVSSLKSDYYMPNTMLEGHVTTSVSQNITVEDDMIIREVYVQQGDTVAVGDPLISFDMTLVEMELNIARLRSQQIEQQLKKARQRLQSLKNGGPIVEEDNSLGGLDSFPGTNMENTDSSGLGDLARNGVGTVGEYLAAAAYPLLVSAFTDGSGLEEENAPSGESMPDSGAENFGDLSQGVMPESDIQYQEPSSNGAFTDGVVQGGGTGELPQNPDISIPPEMENGTELEGMGEGEFSDQDIYFYKVLDYDSEPASGTGTEEDPYIFLCSSAEGGVRGKGSFFNKMAGYTADGTKVEHEGGSWFQLEFHDMDYVADFENRMASCVGYYLIDGGLLKEPANPDSEMVFTLQDAMQVQPPEEELPSLDGMGGGDLGGNPQMPAISREDAIKSQETIISGLELDQKENALNITKLEKRVDRKDIYSKLDGIVDYMGDPITGATTENSFMRIKSKDGFYVTGTVGELMLDQVKEGTVLNCMSYESGNFTAEVLEVSDYPISAETYMGEGNPNVSYYTYNAAVTDKSILLRDQDWLTVTLQTEAASDGSMVLPKAFVRTENGASYVYKDDKGVLKKQPVTVGANVDGGYSVMIKEGIREEDKIAFPYGKNVVEGAKTVEGTMEEMYGY